MDWAYYTAAGDVMAEQQAELTDDEAQLRRTLCYHTNTFIT